MIQIVDTRMREAFIEELKRMSKVGLSRRLFVVTAVAEAIDYFDVQGVTIVLNTDALDAYNITAEDSLVIVDFRGDEYVEAQFAFEVLDDYTHDFIIVTDDKALFDEIECDIDVCVCDNVGSILFNHEVQETEPLDILHFINNRR